MGATAHTFRDATDAPARVHFPEVVAAFEALGFQQIGRPERAQRDVARIARAYAEEHRQLFVDQQSVPMVVMTAPDGNAIVQVDWWWDMPDVRIRTPMSDGSVVETWRAWDRAPVLPKSLDRIRDKLDLAEEQIFTSAPSGGRSIAAVPGTPADLWAEHQRRVESWARGRRTEPLACRDLEQAVELGRQLSAHDGRVAVGAAGVALTVLLSLLLALAIFVLHDFGADGWLGLFVDVVALVLWAIALRTSPRWLRRILYVRSLRAPYTAERRRRRRAAVAVVACTALAIGGAGVYDAVDSSDSYAFRHTQKGSHRPVTYDPCRPVEYVIGGANAAAGTGAILGQVIQEISAATGLTFVHRVGASPSAALPSPSPGATSRRPVVIGWASPEEVARLKDAAGIGGSIPGANAKGELEYVSGAAVFNGPVIARVLMEPNGPARVRAIMLHELGHVVGLDHVNDESQVMHENGGQLELGPGDRAGLAALGGRCLT